MLALFLAATIAASGTSLTVITWPQGPPAPRVVKTLRCDPAGGTLPRAAAACRQLAALDDPFTPVSPGSVCTQIYGGPREALVVGRHAGGRVWTRFNRRDGCQIARWNEHRFLFVR